MSSCHISDCTRHWPWNKVHITWLNTDWSWPYILKMVSMISMFPSLLLTLKSGAKVTMNSHQSVHPHFKVYSSLLLIYSQMRFTTEQYGALHTENGLTKIGLLRETLAIPPALQGNLYLWEMSRYGNTVCVIHSALQHPSKWSHGSPEISQTSTIHSTSTKKMSFVRNLFIHSVNSYYVPTMC